MYAPEATSYKSRYAGTNIYSSWIIKLRATIDATILLDPSSRAMFLDNERVSSILELADDLMLIHLFNLDILISNNFELFVRVNDPD